MNIFGKIYADVMLSTLKRWSYNISSDLNESSATCYPNGMMGLSFGDRLEGYVFITRAYLFQKLKIEKLSEEILPMPISNIKNWDRVIKDSTLAINSKNSIEYGEAINSLFGAVYYCRDWDIFFSDMLGYVNDDDVISALINKMEKLIDTGDGCVERNLTEEEIISSPQLKFRNFGLFNFVHPHSEEFYEQPKIEQIWNSNFIPVWDKDGKYKDGDILQLKKGNAIVTTGFLPWLII